MLNDKLELVNSYYKLGQTLLKNRTAITNWGRLVLQIGAALFYYKFGQTLLQIAGASLLQFGLQIGAVLIYYKFRLTLLRIRGASLLQIGANVVTN